MHNKLIQIIEAKKQEVARLKDVTLWGMDNELPSLRDFKAAISIPGRINLIAEIKFASPSAGLIREKTDPCPIGRTYEDAGAAAISLLTDKEFFNGDPDNLPLLKRAVSVPILRKDFIIDEIQVRESYYYGADAILLIGLCREMKLTPLTEVHDMEDLDKAIECGADVIGINNRDLDTFEVNTNTTLSLAPMVPEDCIVVSESGINNAGDIIKLNGTGINAVLVGSALMKSDDIAAKTREMVQARF
jgi:indole-3-glycerol phosphate synthase